MSDKSRTTVAYLPPRICQEFSSISVNRSLEPYFYLWHIFPSTKTGDSLCFDTGNKTVTATVNFAAQITIAVCLKNVKACSSKSLDTHLNYLTNVTVLFHKMKNSKIVSNSVASQQFCTLQSTSHTEATWAEWQPLDDASNVFT